MDYSSIAFLFSILLPATRQIKKAMGGLEAAHGLYFLIQMVMTAPGRPPSPCFPSTTNYLV
jgi:hypothetical protein